MSEKPETEPDQLNNSETPTTEIIGVTIPEDDTTETDLFPLVISYSNEHKELKMFKFDEYFKLVNRFVWNGPDFAKDADVITMEKKMKDAAPYNVFFSSLDYSPETKDQLCSIRFQDLLCPSLGKLKCSLHINFIVDIEWMLSQFARRNLHKLPMTIVHGSGGSLWPERETMKELYSDIDHYYIKLRQTETDYGCHHTNLSIFVYEDDSLRVVIGSPDQTEQDWSFFNQQIWVSPPCPKIPKESLVTAGESPTGFKRALLNYLLFYKVHNVASIEQWIERITKTDFSNIKVALIYSVPGVHYPGKNGSILHFLGHFLSRDCTISAPIEEHDRWRIIAQVSAIGRIGIDPKEWLTTYLLKALGSHTNLRYSPTRRCISKAEFSLIFPSVQNYRDGYPEAEGASCCDYVKDLKDLQPWLLKHQCQWKADGTKRSRAMPHSKSYCRISPCWKKMAYYFLTSANLSRNAWGNVKRDSSVYARSYEAGVLFLPKYFGEEYFEVKDSAHRKNKKLFPIMFDLPVVPYGPNDDSYCDETELDDVKNNTEDNADQSNKEEQNVTSKPEQTRT